MILFTTPILILGFRRPANIKRIIDAIRPDAPKLIFFAVDGPRSGKAEEETLVLQTQKAIENIDWECEVRVRFRDKNLGIRKAVPDAVSWALESSSEVIVIEDDAIPGPDLLEFMRNQLEKFRDDTCVAHVSGYNLVPNEKLSEASDPFRLSIYPESYLWGTWAESWKIYNDNIDDYVSIVRKMRFSQLEKMIWRINFRMAQKDLIQSWAYRWIASMWRENKVCISPNVNLTTYIGSQDGTHTRRKSRVVEIPLKSLNFDIEKEYRIQVDFKADTWIGNKVFKSSHVGLVEQLAALTVLWALSCFKRDVQGVK
jgi:hypothetical protein